MNRNLKFFFDKEGTPRARGPHAEQILTTFLETDVQGSDHVCHDIMDDLTAIEDRSADIREFEGNAHSVVITPDGVVIRPREGADGKADDDTAALQRPAADATPQAGRSDNATAGKPANGAVEYRTGLKHFRQILEDWEAFILDDLDDQDELDDV